MAKLLIPANGWRPRPHQIKFWGALEAGKRRAIEVAHRRWGKDEIALNWAAVSSMTRIGGYWHMLPEYAQARKAIWTAVNPHTGKRRIDEAFPNEIRENTNEQEMFIRFKTGSTWQVIGSDNYDRLVGVSIAGLTASEWAIANPSAWGYLAPIVAENNGWALFITTPRGKNHAYAMLNMARKSPDWFAEVSTVADTKAISLDIVEQQRAEYHALYGADAGDALIEQEFYCSFEAAILGAYWGKEMAQAAKEGRIGVVEPVPGQLLHTAWDLGVRDSMVIWFFQVVGRRVLVLGCYAASGYGIKHYADIIKEYAKRLKLECGFDYVPHDARQREMGVWVDNPLSPDDGKAKQRIEVMIECGLHPKKIMEHTLADGISAVRQILPRCYFDEIGCGDEPLEGLRQYQTEWDDEAKIFSDKPLHNWASHFADGFRSLAMACREVIADPIKRPPRGLVVGNTPPPGWEMPTYSDILELEANEPKVKERI